MNEMRNKKYPQPVKPVGTKVDTRYTKPFPLLFSLLFVPSAPVKRQVKCVDVDCCLSFSDFLFVRHQKSRNYRMIDSKLCNQVSFAPTRYHRKHKRFCFGLVRVCVLSANDKTHTQTALLSTVQSTITIIIARSHRAFGLWSYVCTMYATHMNGERVPGMCVCGMCSTLIRANLISLFAFKLPLSYSFGSGTNCFRLSQMHLQCFQLIANSDSQQQTLISTFSLLLL